jgi:hypothetical protein
MLFSLSERPAAVAHNLRADPANRANEAPLPAPSQRYTESLSLFMGVIAFSDDEGGDARHPARIYDYGLGGKNHFEADRVVAEKAWAEKRSDQRRHPKCIQAS